MSETRLCSRCGEESGSRAKFCPECGERLRSDDGGERRVVTVVFADLSGFTAYSENTDPERVRVLADQAAAGLGEIVRRYGGTVDKVIGDCVMAVFGAPVAHEDDPERAVRAALEMQAFVGDNQGRFAGMPLRIGINTGEVMYASVGGSETVIGDTVNTAARLQSGAARGQVVIGAGTARAVADAIELEVLDAIVAKGKGEPVPAWRAVVVRGELKRVVRRAPLVGRDGEVARLVELFDMTVVERRAHVAVVLGEAGMGKTRLVTDVTGRLRGGGAQVCRGRCLAYGEGITYWPIVEVIREATGIATDDATTEVASKLDAWLTAIGTEDSEEMRTIAGAVSHLMGVRTTPRGTYRVGDISQAELHWGIRRLLELLAASHPVVLVLEDLQWAEPTFLDLVTFIGETREAPLLVLGTARPELLERAPALLERSAYRRVVNLKPLDADASEELLARLVGYDDVVGSHLMGLLRTVGGNPLFLEETVRMLGERGLLDSDGRLLPDVDPSALEVPDTVQALIDARLDQLDENEQLVLGCASILGHVFRRDAVDDLLQTAGVAARPSLDDVLQRLARRDLVRDIEGELQFGHLLVRDAVYNRMPKRRRCELHQRSGARIAGEGGDDVVEIVAYHYEQACRLGAEVGVTHLPLVPASRALIRSAERAESRDGTREASRYYERALDLIGERLPETRTEVRLSQAQLQVMLGQLATAGDELALVSDAAVQVGRDDLRCRALVDLGHVERATGRVAQAREHVSEARALATSLGEDLLRVRAAFAMASIRGAEGDVDGAVAEIDEALETAARADELKFQAQGYIHVGVLRYNGGQLAEAEAAFERCAALGALDGSVRYQALATTFLGIIRRYRGTLEECESLLRKSLAWLGRTADRYVEVQARRALASLLLDKGDLAGAERMLQETTPMAEQFGGWLAADVYRALADTHARAGRTGDAVIAAGAAREAARDGDESAKASSWMAEAAVASAMGDAEIAAEAFTTAITLLQTKGLVLDVADARLQAGRTLARLGDPRTAEEHLVLARSAFISTGATAAAAEAEAALLEVAAVA